MLNKSWNKIQRILIFSQMTLNKLFDNYCINSTGDKMLQNTKTCQKFNLANVGPFSVSDALLQRHFTPHNSRTIIQKFLEQSDQ